MALTCRELPEAEVLHGACGDQRLLWVVEDVGQGVHSDVVVRDVHPHGLDAFGGEGITTQLWNTVV